MLSLDTLDITDEQAYANKGYPYAEWDLLRRELVGKPARRLRKL